MNEVVHNGIVFVYPDPEKENRGYDALGVVPATEPPMPKLEQIAQVDEKNSV